MIFIAKVRPCVWSNVSVFSFWLLSLASSSQRLIPGIIWGLVGRRCHQNGSHGVPIDRGLPSLDPGGAGWDPGPGCGCVPWDVVGSAAAACLASHGGRNLSVRPPPPPNQQTDLIFVCFSGISRMGQQLDALSAAVCCLRQSIFHNNNRGRGKMLPLF